MSEFNGTTYSGWHHWLWKHHRLATNPTPCVNCGDNARTWSHTNTCTDTQWGTASGSGHAVMAWCKHLWHYVPMCSSCHHVMEPRGLGLYGQKRFRSHAA